MSRPRERRQQKRFDRIDPRAAAQPRDLEPPPGKSASPADSRNPLNQGCRGNTPRAALKRSLQKTTLTHSATVPTGLINTRRVDLTPGALPRSAESPALSLPPHLHFAPFVSFFFKQTSSNRRTAILSLFLDDISSPSRMLNTQTSHGNTRHPEKVISHRVTAISQTLVRSYLRSKHASKDRG